MNKYNRHFDPFSFYIYGAGMVAYKPKDIFTIKKILIRTMKIEITADWILTEFSKNIPMMDFDSYEYDIVDDKYGWHKFDFCF